MMVKKELVPPDGGWGWVIVLASALSNLVIIPVMQSFGLLFKDTFANMGLSHTDRSTIMNTNSAVMMLMGLVNGPLLRRYSFRKVALMGATLGSLGLILTATATSFTQYLIYYGFITSFGTGMQTSAFQLALNTYFKERRNKATGFAMTITGLGPILMPQLINLLLTFYTTEQTIFIIGGLSLHAFVAAILLQPVKWHMKEKVDAENALKEAGEEEELVEENKDQVMTLLEKDPEPTPNPRPRKSSTYSVDYDHEMGAIYGFDTPLAGSVLSLAPASNNNNHRKHSIQQEVTVNKWWSNSSLNTVNLGSSIGIFDEKGRRMSKAASESNKNESNSVYNELCIKKGKETNSIVKFLKGIVNFFDLKLLCDPVFVNIMIGMSLAIFAELNFSILTPFIMADFGLNTSQSATFLSVLSIADLVFRFFAPFIGDYLRKPPRKMYMLTLLLLIISRFMLILFPAPSTILWIAVALGVAKGVRTVYMSLVIPSAVPLERLAAAAGLQMVVNGIFIIIGGPLLGVIRDATGSYSNCIIVMNFITLSCILMWTVEMLYVKFKKPKVNEEGKLNPVYLLMCSSFKALLCAGLSLGVAKGVRIVYMVLIIPSYAPLERLAAAQGLQMVVNGICIAIGGPLLGLIRDVTGSYSNCIVVLNLISLSCIIMWSTEMLYFKCKTSVAKTQSALVKK